MRAILTYHSIDGSGSPISVSEDAFRAHVRWLASGAVRVVGLTELPSVPPGDDAVAITFDDALDSFGSVAGPLLMDAGLPVTVFVVSSRTGLDNSWSGRADYGIPTFGVLSWSALAAWAERGVTMGAHTRDHPDLTTLSPDCVSEQMEAGAEAMQIELGVRPRAFAYPYGGWNEHAVSAARQWFDLAVTTELDLIGESTDLHRLPRLDMYYYRTPARLTAWGTPAFRRYLQIRRAGRAIRRALARRAAT